VGDTTHLLARAILYRAAAKCLTYPDASLLAYLRTEASAEIEGAASMLPLLDAATKHIATFVAALGALDSTPLGLAEEHTYLFAREVRCPPYESSYAEGRSAGKADVMADVAGFYEAFGYRLSEASDLSDHVGAELEFLAVLSAKEAIATEHGWPDEAEVTREARRRFHQEHVGRWLSAFAQRVGQQARLPFYPALVELIAAVISDESRLWCGARTG
jgi:TorA-specific chaperone